MDDEPQGSFWAYAGMGVLIFLTCIGMGTCQLLSNADAKININQNVELK